MGRPAIDLTGKKFGRLTVVDRDLSIVGRAGRHAKWRCVCECGNKSVIESTKLTSGETVSCGCYGREMCTAAHTRHDMSKTRIFGLWANMLRRCASPSDKDYQRYGARGIDVCSRWLVFENFYSDMGERPIGKTLDRIDNDKGYGPDNCRWATRKEQSGNRRNTIYLEHEGVRKTLVDWAQELGLSEKTIHTRIFRGCSPERLLRPSAQSR